MVQAYAGDDGDKKTVQLPSAILPPEVGEFRDPETLCLIPVQADNMFPTLSVGDHALVDTTQAEIAAEGVYAIKVGSQVFIKRVLINPSTELVTLKSDNPSCDSWDDIDQDELDVLGRIIWAGCRL